MSTRRRRLQRACLSAIASVLGIGLVIACSIDLDPPLSGAPAEAGDAALGDASSTDAPNDQTSEAAPPPECQVDKDCPSVNGCVTPRCDTKKKRCVFDVCPSQNACSFKKCDRDAKTCAATAEPIAFFVHTMTVPGTIACDTPSRCVSLGYPFLYMALDGAAVAVDVSGIGTAPPVVLPIEGIDFSPANVVASGRYTFFVGRPFLAASPGIRVGWLDAPRHPFVEKLVAASTPSNFPDSNPALYRALPAPGDGIYLGVVLSNGSTQYYATLHPPLGDTNAFVILPPSAGGGISPRAPVASSGERVLVNAGLFGDTFFFVRRPGNDTSFGSTITLRPGGQIPIAAQSTFAQDDEGRIVWNAGLDNGAGAIGRVRLSFLSDTDQAVFDGGAPGADLVAYDGGVAVTSVSVGPAAIVGGSAVGLSREGAGGTAVQLVRHDGGATATVPNRRHVLTGDPSAMLGAFSANGLVFVVEQTRPDPDPPAVAIHVFAPSCDP